MKLLTLGFVVPALILLDLMTKVWARLSLGEGVGLDFGQFLALQLTENAGVSFGLLDFGSGAARFISLAITVALTVIVGLWLVRTASEWQRLFVALIFAGASSNIIDRIVNGGVTDFLAYRWFGQPLFVGNLADVWITVGAAFAFGSLLIAPRATPSIRNAPEGNS